jgi:hypothetical protein
MTSRVPLATAPFVAPAPLPVRAAERDRAAGRAASSSGVADLVGGTLVTFRVVRAVARVGQQ